MAQKPTYEELERQVRLLQEESAELKPAKDRLTHLNLVLRAVRKVHQLIIREKDRAGLLEGVCEKLVETRGYQNAWIAYLDQAGRSLGAVESGLGKSFAPLRAQCEKGEIPHCCREALEKKGVVITPDPSVACPDCPLSAHYNDSGAMTVPLGHDENIYALLSASIPQSFIHDKEEQFLLLGLAEDLGFALHLLDVQEKREQVETDLEKAIQDRALVLETASENIVSYDPDLRILWANRSACETFGLKPEELVGKHCYEIVHRASKPCSGCPTKEAFSSGLLQEREVTTPDGRIWFSHTYPVKGPSGDVESVIMFALDITARKQIEKALLESEANFRALAENAGDGVSIIVEDGSHIYANRRTAEITGYSVEELNEINLVKLIHPDELEKIMAMLRKRLSGDPVATRHETVIVQKNGKSVPVEVSGARTNWHGRTADIVFSRDISKRKEAEVELSRKHAELEAIFNAIPDAVIFADLERRLTKVNPGFTKLFGYDSEEVDGKRTRILYANVEEFERQGRERYNPYARDMYQSYEVEYRKKNGDIFLSETVGTPVTNDHDEAIGLVAIVRDITERKRAEAALRESEEFSSSLLENSPSPIIVINPDHAIRYVNPAFESLTGYAASEIVGRTAPYPWWMGGSSSISMKEFGVALERGLSEAEFAFRKKNGDLFWVEITSVPVKSYGNLKYYLSNWIEITERKRAEEIVRESEERFRKTVENAPFGYFRVDKDGLWQYVNPQWEKMHGFSLDEIKGKSFGMTQPEDANEQIRENMRRALTGEKISGEFKRCRKDGSIGYYSFNIQPVYKEGVVIAVEGFITDLTKQKRAEEHIRRLSQQLLEVQEMERQLISRELHDRVAQDLSASKISCDTLMDNQSTVSPVLKQRIFELSAALERSIMAVRDLSYELRPPGLETMGLGQTFYQYCKDFSSRYGIEIDFQCAGMESLKLNANAEINLYRMVQEGLNNVLKHAEAAQVRVKLVAAYPDIILRIEDNGKGFDVENRLISAADERRMGLRSMQERTALLGGEMTIQASSGHGTKICIRFPHFQDEEGHDPE